MMRSILIMLGLLIAIPAFAQNISNPGFGSYQSGPFASRPASPNASNLYYATDLGTGILISYNGTNWVPVGHIAAIAQSSTAVPLTGTASETNLATISIPGGLLSTAGSLRTTLLFSYTNSANNKILTTRFSASSGITGTIIQPFTVTTSATSRIQNQIYNLNSLSSQISANGSTGSGASGGATTPTSINTANASFLNLTGTLASTGETITLLAYTVEWIEP